MEHFTHCLYLYTMPGLSNAGLKAEGSSGLFFLSQNAGTTRVKLYSFIFNTLLANFCDIFLLKTTKVLLKVVQKYFNNSAIHVSFLYIILAF